MMSTIIPQKPNLSINGIPVYDLSISVNRDIETVYSFDGAPTFRYPKYSLPEIEFNLVLFGEAEEKHKKASLLEKMFYDTGCGGTTSLCKIGDSNGCEHCGHLLPAGVSVCPGCQGKTSIFPMSGIDSISMILTSFTYPPIQPRDDAPVMISFTSVMKSKLEIDEYGPTMFNGNLISALSIDDGLYVCSYCGMIAEKYKPCPGCQSRQLPLMDAINVERTCLYCHQQVVGSIVCSGCGARIISETIKAKIV